MFRHLRHPATVLSAIALFVALGGGAVAYASGLISGSHIKNHSIAEKKLTKKAIRQLRGHRGPRGATGAHGPQGPAGPAGTALGYAHVNSDGTLDAANSSGVTATNFTHPGPGEYCFQGLGFTPHNVVATIDSAGAGSTPGPNAQIALSDVSTYCPAGSQVGVVTQNDTAHADYGVYILFN